MAGRRLSQSAASARPAAVASTGSFAGPKLEG